MGFLRNRIRNDTTFTLSDPLAAQFFSSMGIDLTNIGSSSELNEIVYFTCISHLAKTMSKMPWEKRRQTEKKGKERVFDSDIDLLLNLRPNPLYTASTYWATTEINKLHYGNSFSYIEFVNGKAKALWLLPANEVQIWRDDKGIWGNENSVWYVWTDSRNGKQYKFFQSEILHHKTDFTFDGIVGISVRQMLKTQIRSKMFADGYLKKLYENNMFGGKVILHYTGDLNTKTEIAMAEKIENYAKSQGSGKFIPLPLGVEAKLLDMKLSDAEFLETQKLSALQIAAAFGIKPNIINDYAKSSYSNSETQQLDFYVNTLQPSFVSYEQEISYKLLPNFELKKGNRLEINEKKLFKMDSRTKAEVYGKYINNFVMTPNEVREEEGLAYSEGADDLIGNGNFIKLNQIGTQWNKGGGGNN